MALARDILTALERTGTWTGDIRSRRKDGRAFWTHANIAAVNHPSLGRVWVSVQSDITDLRRLRDERDAAHHALERLTDHVQDEMEELRRQIAREVHDEIGAALTGIRLRLEAKLHRMGHGERRDQEDMRRLRDLVDRAIGSTRHLCSRLRPPMLDDLGLVETCRWYLRDWSMQTGIRAQGRFGPLAGEPVDALRTDVFRILQELLTNVARHAEATRVSVSLSGKHAGLRLRVRDNGQGFQTESGPGIGIVGIRERLRRQGGSMDIDSGQGGSTVVVRIPVATP
jgi:signal transduction histidine kinase